MTITAEDKRDMQGLLLYAYSELEAACFITFSMGDTGAFKQWLGSAVFHDAEASPRKAGKDRCLNIAFTRSGLQKLSAGRFHVTNEEGFDPAFLAGMDTDYKNRLLGDFDLNDPIHWRWGSRKDQKTDGVLLLYATTRNLLDQYILDLKKESAGSWAETADPVYTGKLPHEKEHFGFTDGISQPVLRGLERTTFERNYINPGEVILGYPNDYGKEPLSPALPGFNKGRNSSYLVIREMQQDVKAFWKTVSGFGPDPITIASKMIGRWPNGIPLVLAETKEEAEQLKERKQKELIPPGQENSLQWNEYLNDFSFWDLDKDGLKCPLGAHIRRGNPKDSKNENPADPKDPKINPNDVSNKHRVIRRGRSFGRPFVPSMEVKDILQQLDKDDNEVRGLNFLCFNTDINRQFEFIQQTWMNNTKFLGMYDEVDPLIGVNGHMNKETKKMEMRPTSFTIPQCPVRHKIESIPPFVKVAAGGYFFFPSISIVRYLAK